MSQDELAALAVNKLWSPIDAERRSGFSEILELGAPCARPLIALLEDLIRDPSPRFPTGKEGEGDSAIRDSLRAWRETQDVWSPASAEAGRRLGDLAVNTSLMSDAIELLGKLKAADAVPVLLTILRGNVTHLEIVLPEMVALYRIGSEAVPFLIQEIEQVDTTAREAFDIVQGSMLSMDPPLPPLQGAEPLVKPTVPSAEDLEEDEEDFVWRRRVILKRVMTILGRIRDPAALPCLRRLLAHPPDSQLAWCARESARKIEFGPEVPELIPPGMGGAILFTDDSVWGD